MTGAELLLAAALAAPPAGAAVSAPAEAYFLPLLEAPTVPITESNRAQVSTGALRDSWMAAQATRSGSPW